MKETLLFWFLVSSLWFLAGCATADRKGTQGLSWMPNLFSDAQANIGDKLEKSEKLQGGGDVVTGRKESIEVSLVNLGKADALSVLGLGCLVVAAGVTWAALRIVVEAVGRARARSTAEEVKRRTRVNPLLHPVRWMAGKVITATADGGGWRVTGDG